MKTQYYIVSLCKNGILGGGLTVDDTAVTYHTNKLTVPDEYRRLQIKYADIEKVTFVRALLLPAVQFHLKNQKVYKFLLFFGRKRLADTLSKMGLDIAIDI